MCYGQILEDGLRNARKAHRCWACNRFIQPGERYKIFKGVDGGAIQTTRTCLGCEAKLDAADAWGEGECIVDAYDIIRERASDSGWKAFRKAVRDALTELKGGA